MQFYPAYKLQDVLDEYAIRFYMLLNEAYRIEAANYKMLATIAMLPGNSELATQILDQLGWASKDPDDILSSSDDDYSGIDDLKRVLR